MMRASPHENPRSSQVDAIAWSAALALALAVALPGCKKSGDSSPPDDVGAAQADDDDGGDADQADADADQDSGEAQLTATSFEETVNDHIDDVVGCYEQSRAENPELAGTLEANFTIAADGSIAAVAATDASSLKDEGLINCIKGKAAGWGFGKPASGESMTLTFPFDLTPPPS